MRKTEDSFDNETTKPEEETKHQKKKTNCIMHCQLGM